MVKHEGILKGKFELCKNCGEPILLSTDFPEKLGMEPWEGEAIWVHLETLTNMCMIVATPSGKQQEIEYERVEEDDEIGSEN